jgi:hypothetical protein
MCNQYAWVFVVATGRSGSTTAEAMLDSIPGVLVGGEERTPAVLTICTEAAHIIDRASHRVPPPPPPPPPHPAVSQAAECSDTVLGYIGALENTQNPGNAASPDGLGYRLGGAVSGVSLDRCGELCT